MEFVRDQLGDANGNTWATPMTRAWATATVRFSRTRAAWCWQTRTGETRPFPVTAAPQEPPRAGGCQQWVGDFMSRQATAAVNPRSGLGIVGVDGGLKSHKPQANAPIRRLKANPHTVYAFDHRPETQRSYGTPRAHSLTHPLHSLIPRGASWTSNWPPFPKSPAAAAWPQRPRNASHPDRHYRTRQKPRSTRPQNVWRNRPAPAEA